MPGRMPEKKALFKIVRAAMSVMAIRRISRIMEELERPAKVPPDRVQYLRDIDPRIFVASPLNRFEDILVHPEQSI